MSTTQTLQQVDAFIGLLEQKPRKVRHYECLDCGGISPHKSCNDCLDRLMGAGICRSDNMVPVYE